MVCLKWLLKLYLHYYSWVNSCINNVLVTTAYTSIGCCFTSLMLWMWMRSYCLLVLSDSQLTKVSVVWRPHIWHERVRHLSTERDISLTWSQRDLTNHRKRELNGAYLMPYRIKWMSTELAKTRKYQRHHSHYENITAQCKFSQNCT